MDSNLFFSYPWLHCARINWYQGMHSLEKPKRYFNRLLQLMAGYGALQFICNTPQYIRTLFPFSYIFFTFSIASSQLLSSSAYHVINQTAEISYIFRDQAWPSLLITIVSQSVSEFFQRQGAIHLIHRAFSFLIIIVSDCSFHSRLTWYSSDNFMK